MKGLLIGLLIAFTAGCIRAKDAVVHVEYRKKEVVKLETRIKRGSGTGFYVSHRGHVLTAAHVVSKALGEGGTVLVYINGPKHLPQRAYIVEIDTANDLALLKVAPTMSHRAFKFCDDVERGEMVMLKAWRYRKREQMVGRILGAPHYGSFLYVTSAVADYGFSGAPAVSVDRQCVAGVVTNGIPTGDNIVAAIRHPRMSELIIKALKKHAPEALELFED